MPSLPPISTSSSSLDPHGHLAQCGLWRGHVLEGVLAPNAWDTLRQYVHSWVLSDDVQAECERYQRGERVCPSGKPFRILYRPQRVYDVQDPLLLLTRVMSLQALAASVVGPVKLVCLDLQHNPPNCDLGTPAWSQTWHRDPEDPQVVKIFIYFSDVGLDAGPFQYVLGSHVAWFHLCLGGQYPAENLNIEEHVPRELICPVVGPAGTVAVCATSGLHRGGTGKLPRTMATLTYVPIQSPSRAKYRVENVSKLVV